MPRAKIEAAFLGWQTVRILAGVPDKQAAWLIKAICAWILEDNEPDGIPSDCIGSWIAIRDESVRIHEARKQHIDAGRSGGLANGKRTESEGEANASEGEANGKRRDTKIESKSKSKRENISGEKKNPSHAGAREVWLDDLTECPVPPDKLSVLAAHLELSPADLGAWKDYYTAQGWRRWPTSPRPMTPAAAEASLRFWKTKKGIEAERQAHIDAKMDERAAKRDAARDPSRFAPPPEKGGIDTAALGI